MIHYVYWCHIYVLYGVLLSYMFVLKLVYTCALPTSLHGCIWIYWSPMVSYLLWSCRGTLCHQSALWIWSSVRMIASKSMAISCISPKFWWISALPYLAFIYLDYLGGNFFPPSLTDFKTWTTAFGMRWGRGRDFNVRKREHKQATCSSAKDQQVANF